MKDDFFQVFKKFNMLKKKELNMDKEKEFVDINDQAKKCSIIPYFLMDVSSGDMLSIFSVSNLETAIRTFKMSVENFPEILLKDTVLVRYDDREIVFEGKEYLDEWRKIHDAKEARRIAIAKGVNL